MPKKQYRKDLTIKSNDPKWKKFVDYYNQWWEEKFKEKWYFKYTMRFDDVHIISKKMWFIKWLCDNNKITRTEVYTLDKTHPTYWYTTSPYTTCKSIKLENTITMILSIQENPITFILWILE